MQFGHFSEADAARAGLREKILKRDGYKCEDCDLVLKRHMEVRHRNDDHTDDSPSNLVCVCPFCHLRDHLHATGYAGAAVLIGSMTLNQGLINTLTLAIWYIQSRVPIDIDIRKLPTPGEDLSDLQQLRNVADVMRADFLRGGMRWSDNYTRIAAEPDAFGEMLCDLAKIDAKAYATRGERSAHLHILPLPEAFTVQCRDWFAEFDKTRPISSWSKGLESLYSRMGTSFDDFTSRVQEQQRAVLRAANENLGHAVGKANSYEGPRTPVNTAIQSAGDCSGTSTEDTDRGGVDSSRARVGSRYD